MYLYCKEKKQISAEEHRSCLWSMNLCLVAQCLLRESRTTEIFLVRRLQGQLCGYHGLTQPQQGIALILVFASDDPRPCNSILLHVGLWQDDEACDLLCAPRERFGDSFNNNLRGKMGNKMPC